MKEAEVVELLLSRSGRAMRVVTTDGEAMVVRALVQAKHSENADYLFWVERGGIPLSADGGRYYFYSNEIDRVEDIETGEVILTRQYD